MQRTILCQNDLIRRFRQSAAGQASGMADGVAGFGFGWLEGFGGFERFKPPDTLRLPHFPDRGVP